MYGEQARFFEDEIHPSRKHKNRGVVGMASKGENSNGSQFYITTGENLDSLDEKHTIFGEVAEGLDVVMNISEAYCDANSKPYQNIRSTQFHLVFLKISSSEFDILSSWMILSKIHLY